MKTILISAYNELISDMKKLDFIESITLIGPPVEERELHKIIDIDVIIIVKAPMIILKYNMVRKIYESVCNKYRTKDVDVLYAIADGPMKPKSFKPKEIFFHCVLHTKESYKKMPLFLCKNSWQQFKPIKGIDLKKYQSFNGVTKDMLVNYPPINGRACD